MNFKQPVRPVGTMQMCHHLPKYPNTPVNQSQMNIFTSATERTKR